VIEITRRNGMRSRRDHELRRDAKKNSVAARTGKTFSRHAASTRLDVTTRFPTARPMPAVGGALDIDLLP
jgi:hypothetical protein